MQMIGLPPTLTGWRDQNEPMCAWCLGLGPVHSKSLGEEGNSLMRQELWASLDQLIWESPVLGLVTLVCWLVLWVRERKVN
jgi:hypothetical protein